MGVTTIETARSTEDQTQILSAQKRGFSFLGDHVTKIVLAIILGGSTVFSYQHFNSVPVAPEQPRRERSVPPKIDRLSFEDFEKIKDPSIFLNQTLELDSINSSFAVRALEQNGLTTRNGEKLFTYIVQTDPRDPNEQKKFIFVEVPESLMGTAKNDYPPGSVSKRFIPNTAFEIEVRTVKDQGLFEDTHKRVGKTVFIAKGIIYSPPPPCPYENLPCAVDTKKSA